MVHDWMGTWGTRAWGADGTGADPACLVAIMEGLAPGPPVPEGYRGWASTCFVNGFAGWEAFNRLSALKDTLQDALGAGITPAAPYLGGGPNQPGQLGPVAEYVDAGLWISDRVWHSTGPVPGWILMGSPDPAEVQKAKELLERILDALEPPGSIGGDVFVGEAGAPAPGDPILIGGGGTGPGSCCCRCCCSGGTANVRASGIGVRAAVPFLPDPIWIQRRSESFAAIRRDLRERLPVPRKPLAKGKAGRAR